MAALVPTEDAKIVTGGAIGALLAPRFGTTNMHVTPPPGDFLLALAATQQNRAHCAITKRSKAQRDRIVLEGSGSGTLSGLSGAVFSATPSTPAVKLNLQCGVSQSMRLHQAPPSSSNFFMALQSSML